MASAINSQSPIREIRQQVSTHLVLYLNGESYPYTRACTASFGNTVQCMLRHALIPLLRPTTLHRTCHLTLSALNSPIPHYTLRPEIAVNFPNPFPTFSSHFRCIFAELSLHFFAALTPHLPHTYPTFTLRLPYSAPHTCRNTSPNTSFYTYRHTWPCTSNPDPYC